MDWNGWQLMRSHGPEEPKEILYIIGNIYIYIRRFYILCNFNAAACPLLKVGPNKKIVGSIIIHYFKYSKQKYK